MAILFFDGFDRCTLLKDLDTNYWSFEPQQPIEYKKYAFGGYTYSHNSLEYQTVYNYYSPNNATLPLGQNIGEITYSPYNLRIAGTSYPAFGTPPGFLALSNLDISNTNLLAPITYVQLSGFKQPSGETSFLTTRFLGLETKDSNFHSSDKPGRFGSKHPLVAFCQGNSTGLILNIVKVTGNHLNILENQKMTMGLEIEQLNGVSGTLDLNINDDLIDYKLRSVYDNNISEYTINDIGGRILTITKDLDFEDNMSSPISRWCHFQFGIVNTGTDHYVQVKVEDIDLLSIPSDDTILDKDLWEDRVYISGFTYDNIRFFNRTYNSSLQFKTDGFYFGLNFGDQAQRLLSRYYMRGATTLIDDVILSDNSGSTTTFLGKNAKVIPFSPGIAGNITNNANGSDGLSQWNGNIASNRAILKNADGDDTRISTAASGLISTVAHRPLLPQLPSMDSSSINVWGSIEDGVGGLKIYTQGKKEFLDTSYDIVLRNGIFDSLVGANKVLLNFDEGIIDLSTNNFLFIKSPGIELSTDVFKYGTQSLKLTSGEYLQNNNLERYYNLELNTGDNGGYSWDFEGAIVSPNRTDFTLEAWIKFSGSDQTITLFSKQSPKQPTPNGFSSQFNILVNTGSIVYSSFGERADIGGRPIVSGSLNLYFGNLITDNNWHHIALVNTSASLVAFLDGISGTSYSYYQGGGPYWGSQLFAANPATDGPWSGSYTNTLYYWSNSSLDYVKNFRAFTNYYTFNNDYSRIPTRIFGNGYIDDYRLTFASRYTNNFSPPSKLTSIYDDYIKLGETQNLIKTRYGKIVQFYEYNNPIENQPWTTGLINNISGLILGVKKV